MFLLQHVRPVNDDGRSISKDLDGFPVTCRQLMLLGCVWIKYLQTDLWMEQKIQGISLHVVAIFFPPRFFSLNKHLLKSLIPIQPQSSCFQIIWLTDSETFVKCLIYSGSCHDSMVVLKQESQFAKEYDRSFDRVIYLPLLSETKYSCCLYDT